MTIEEAIRDLDARLTKLEVLAALPTMIRPPFDEIGRLPGYVACCCGQVLQTRERVREHWQSGHFDYQTTRPL